VNLTRQVHDFIRQAGQKARSLRQDKFEVIEKGHLDYVTTVDRTIDEMFTTQFPQWFPQDGIITEENPASMAIWQQDFANLWLIDPIDGTDDFIAGGDNYAVMVGLLQDRVPVMGWIYAPERDRMFYGGVGLGGIFVQDGTGYQDHLIPRIVTRDAPRFLLGDKDQRNYGDLILKAFPGAEFYNMGGFGLKVMEVVMGNADIYIYLNQRVKLWDTVAPLAMAHAVGLVCCDLEGAAIAFTPEAINPLTMAHYQHVVIGWPENIDKFRPKLAEILDLESNHENHP